jgi:hypothetical protein
MASSAIPVDQIVHFSSGTTFVAPAAQVTYDAPAAHATYIAPAGAGASEAAIHGSGVGINIHAQA